MAERRLQPGNRTQERLINLCPHPEGWARRGPVL